MGTRNRPKRNGVRPSGHAACARLDLLGKIQQTDDMAKKSWIAREEKRERLYEKYKEKRQRLKEEGKWVELQKLPRDSSPVRQNNRCELCGRQRGYLRKFGVCRICFRELALEGKIPGIRKASW